MTISVRARNKSGALNVNPVQPKQPPAALASMPVAGTYKVSFVSVTKQGGMTQGELTFNSDQIEEGITDLVQSMLYNPAMQDARLTIKRSEV